MGKYLWNLPTLRQRSQTSPMIRIFPLLLLIALTGCGAVLTPKAPPGQDSTGQTRPEARPEQIAAVSRTPPPAARTVEDFDVTTSAERVAAAAPPAEPAGERRLGTTVASLGDPSRAGFWLETPLVSSPEQGRVVFPATGKSAQVELIPIDGPATGGSRISLAAMRLIEAPLTDLPVIEVFSGG